MNFSLNDPKSAAPVKKPRPPVPKPVSKKDDFVLSIRVNLPDYDKWRIVIFYRQYPYMGIMITAGALLILGLLVTLVRVIF